MHKSLQYFGIFRDVAGIRVYSQNGRKIFSHSVMALLLFSQPATGDTPLGWINSSNNSAYTTTRGDLEVSIAGLAVNSTLDVLNIRDDLIANNQRLIGDSGDLSGEKLELHYGIFRYFSVFYRIQNHSMTVDLGTISSVNLIDIDESLNTTMESAGFKWTFFQANLLNPNNLRTAASIEVSAFRNNSDDFGVVLDEIQFENLTIFFRDPQTFSVNNLEDEGWKARLMYTWPLENLGSGPVWLGYGESNANSGTVSDITSQTIARFFEQSFKLKETYFYLGASLNLQLSPRLPLSISYEYINISDSTFEQFPDPPRTELPGFLTTANQTAEHANHTLKARISYWLTPELNLSLVGNLYSNQFLGVLPHYNNPLSGSFSTIPYGFIGVELGYKF